MPVLSPGLEPGEPGAVNTIKESIVNGGGEGVEVKGSKTRCKNKSKNKEIRARS